MSTGRLWIEYRRLAELAVWPTNPKRHSVEGISDSMRRYSYTDPIMVDETSGRMVRGHGRREALLALKAASEQPPEHVELDEASGDWLIPILRGVSFASEAEAEEYVVADNQLVIVGGWDEQRLAPILRRILDEKSVPLSTIGFTSAVARGVIARALNSANGGSGDDDEAIEQADELAKTWGTALGQLWEIPSATAPGLVHRVLCGDSTTPAAWERVMGTDRAVLCWTDPPYGVDYVGGMKKRKAIANDSTGVGRFLRRAFTAIDGVLEPGAVVYVASPPGPTLLEFGVEFKRRWHLHQNLAWVKDNFALGHSDYRGKYEVILYGWKNGAPHLWFGGRDKSTVLEVDRQSRNELHPTEKPVELIAQCLRNNSEDRAIVVDGFGGGGSTMMACEQTGRLCRAVELHPPYVAVHLERAKRIGLVPRLVEAAS